ncbi:hypothetical protein L596_004673 [Steinernema carpocapsae]|uniref:Thioredoxin domain-containing protein n=1 Tax=Steinernema carpocapsae TaxID=34508 RepID=A0A4U8V0P2_STECR|nr:hypothetical protein L596_004673 [Steinernema carpocapsae]
MDKFYLYLALFFLSCSVVNAGLVTLTMENLDATLQSAQVVFVAFCAEWCPFSRRLRPIFEEAAQKFDVDHPNKSVVWAVVDSVQHPDVSDKYFVNKYPTMKVFINGELISKEYRYAHFYFCEHFVSGLPAPSRLLLSSSSSSSTSASPSSQPKSILRLPSTATSETLLDTSTTATDLNTRI